MLIEGEKIAAVGKNIEANDAEMIDASQMIVLPGLINGHLHTWQTGLRGLAADWTVAEYMQAMHRGLATLFRPEDIYIGNCWARSTRSTTALRRWLTGATTIRRRSTPTPRSAAWKRPASARCSCTARRNPIPNPANRISAKCRCRAARSSDCAKVVRERRRADYVRPRDSGPYYSTYEVTCADLELAQEFDLFASMHVGGGTGKVPDGFERLLADKLVDGHLTVVHGNDMAPDTVRADRRSRRNFHRDGRDRIADGLRRSAHRHPARLRMLRSRSAPTSSRRSAATCLPACA